MKAINGALLTSLIPKHDDMDPIIAFYTPLAGVLICFGMVHVASSDGFLDQKVGNRPQ